jgi:hypothetical protein
VPWCRRLVPAFLSRRPGFEPRAFIVGFSEEQIVTARPGREADPSPPSNPEVKNRVERYVYSPRGPSWLMKG